jgi:hypothetical protein
VNVEGQTAALRERANFRRAIVLFILTDKAGQPEPIPLVIKLVILLIALLAIANRLGYA